MITPIPILALLFTLTSARDQIPNYLIFNASQSVPTNGYDSFQTASQNPNATHTVNFNYNNVTEAGRNWSWTLEISDVPMPNATYYNNTSRQNVTLPNAHVALTTYDLSWPEGETLDDAADARSCLYMIYGRFQPNVLDLYDSSSSSCDTVLGEECLGAIRDAMRPGRSCETSNFPRLNSLPASCGNSLGQTTGGMAVNAYPFGEGGEVSFQNGSSYAWVLSPPYSAGNDTAFEFEESQLHMVAITTGSDVQLLCNRISAQSSSGESGAMQRKAERLALLLSSIAILYSILA
ncbi:hypothetical protein HII31_06802 [Pseudocercospora fuligena]|uniref:Uncharacterized protein n=1 Tax=Pseudocercospora fuligena TaxID=685502 RepID=A0A8H6VIK5_9PEZI|nr:hypothetical protein HII31_06802 [Pseudocercospora fuligena]